MTRVRIFNGREYRYHSEFRNKSTARQAAAALRKKGYNVRVVTRRLSARSGPRATYLYTLYVGEARKRRKRDDRRKFGRRVFELEGVFKHKRDAVSRAKRLRAEGMYARVVKRRDGYAVYSNDGPPTFPRYE